MHNIPRDPSPRAASHGSVADLRNILICVALFLLAAAATVPVLEMGFNDDPAYVHMAREFAATGRFLYNGWAAMMLIPQVVWAALFIKIFGFSFFVVRLSTVVLGVFLIPVLYGLGRESGLAPPFATFVTLLGTLSPVFLPEAISFMSDVPAFFLFAICCYGGIKSWKASTSQVCVGWAGLIVLAGVLSGLDRQIYWLGPLLFLPVVAWIHRRSKGTLLCLGVAWLSAISAMVCFVRWFQAKPYAISEHTLDKWKHPNVLHLAQIELVLVAKLALTGALLLFPLLVGYAAPGLKAVSRKAAALAVSGVLAVGFAVSILHHALPILGNILTEYGMFGPGIVAIGEIPVILPPVIRGLLTVAVLLSCAGCGLALWKHRGTSDARLGRDPAIPALVLGLLFAAVLLLILLYRTAAFDRYLIPLLPLLAIPLLRHYQVHISQSVSRWSWAMLALFALYGIAITHDAFAAGRARLTAARALEQAGIARTEIRAGFEYDIWTQLETAGYLNNADLENPAGAYRPVTCTGPGVVRLWFVPMMPAIHARYFVTLSRLSKLEDGPAAPVSYTAWLPTGRRQVFTQVLPGGGHQECR